MTLTIFKTRNYILYVYPGLQRHSDTVEQAAIIEVQFSVILKSSTGATSSDGCLYSVGRFHEHIPEFLLPQKTSPV